MRDFQTFLTEILGEAPAGKAGLPLAAAIALTCAGSPVHASLAGKHAPAAQSWPVTSCDDHGSGSLRQVIGSNQTQSGDTIDLSQIQCATITLSTGQIDIPQDDLTLQGPGANRLTIDAGGSSRLFAQSVGKLRIDGLTLTGGTYHAVGAARGGCVLGKDAVYLSHTVLSNCTVSSDSGIAGGGAVFAVDITLVASRVSDSESVSPIGFAYGGGIAASDGVLAKYSTLSANAAQSAMTASDGGAIYAGDYASVIASTIDHNTASLASGIHAHRLAKIKESTISGNFSTQCCALMGTGNGGIGIYNSTVAFNHSDAPGQGAVYFKGTMIPLNSVVLQSSILANNTAGTNDDPADLLAIYAVVTGADSLVMSANAPIVPGTVVLTANPLLGDLDANGGATKTHALRPGSPALAMGNNSDGAIFDQRGFGYPRETGAAASVDIGAFQFDSIFAGPFD